MAHADIVTLDLNFQNSPNAIACYLIRHSTGAILVECGPGSTVDELKAGLKRLGFAPTDVRKETTRYADAIIGALREQGLI